MVLKNLVVTVLLEYIDFTVCINIMLSTLLLCLMLYQAPNYTEIMGVSLQITHSFAKRMHVSNASNTDFCLFIVLGDELLIHCIYLDLLFRLCLKVNIFIFYT